MKVVLVVVVCFIYIQIVRSDDQKLEDFKVICYFQSSSSQRTEIAKFVPENIDKHMCTLIIYTFANLDESTLKIIPKDRLTDIDNRYYNRMTAFREQGIKVMIALAGWVDSIGTKYSSLLSNQTAQTAFVSSVVEFIETYSFDGLDLDLEYPTCWQGDCKNGNRMERETFAKLVENLSLEFRPRRWILSAAVSSSKDIIDRAYDIPKLNKYLDWIGLMTYDYNGHWRRRTGHLAPLYYHPSDHTSTTSNANFTVNYWIQGGAAPEKLVLGIPLYGRSFTLQETTDHEVNADSDGPGDDSGTYIRSRGVLHICHICNKTKNHHWNVVRDSENRVGAYAYHGTQWVTYNDVDMVRIEAEYVRDMNLAGAMVWSIDLDDFRGDCQCGNYPLLTSLNQELRNIGGVKVDNCTS